MLRVSSLYLLWFVTGRWFECQLLLHRQQSQCICYIFCSGMLWYTDIKLSLRLPCYWCLRFITVHVSDPSYWNKQDFICHRLLGIGHHYLVLVLWAITAETKKKLSSRGWLLTENMLEKSCYFQLSDQSHQISSVLLNFLYIVVQKLLRFLWNFVRPLYTLVAWSWLIDWTYMHFLNCHSDGYTTLVTSFLTINFSVTWVISFI